MNLDSNTYIYFFSILISFKIMRTLQISINPHPSPIGILYLLAITIFRTYYMQTGVNVNTSAIKKKKKFEPQ